MINLITTLFLPANAALDQHQLPSWTEPCKNWLPNLIRNFPDLEESGLSICKNYMSHPERKLSPIHLASILGDHQLLEGLQSIGQNIDLSDAAGFTPLHHMALKGDTVGVAKLLTWGANPDHRNHMGGTYADLLRFNEPFRPSTNFPLNASLFSAHQNDNLSVDPKCVSRGITYVDENVVRPQTLLKFWAQATKFLNNIKIEKDMSSKYEAFKTSPPKLSVEPILTNDKGEKIGLGSSFCGVVAKQAIKKGDLIAEYTGEMTTSAPYVDSGYLWNEWPPVDSKTFRSAASMINHAFPNAEMKHIESAVDGLPARKIFMATQDIAEGEQIAIDYGIHYIWEQNPKQMRPNALYKFIKENSWKEIVDCLINSRDTAKQTQALHILASTSNMVDLANDNLLNRNDFNNIKPLMNKLSGILKTNLTKISNSISKAEKISTDKPDL